MLNHKLLLQFKDVNMNGILGAYELKQDGSGQSLSGAQVSRLIKDDQLAWVHLDGTSLESRVWIQQEITYLDHIIIDALLAEETRPRILEFQEGVLMILRGVNLNDNAQPEDMVSIRLWADEHRIISIERKPLKVVADIQQSIKNDKGPRDTGEFITRLVTRLIERMETFLSDIADELDLIEESLINGDHTLQRQELSSIRKKALIYRRYIAPQRDVLAYLKSVDIEWFKSEHKRKIQESHDKVLRYLEELDMIRERAQIVKEEILATISDRMNKNMYVLSMVTAVFLPLGFLTGLFGINIGGMPGVDSNLAFTVFCVVIVILVISQLIFFRWKRWL